MKDFVNLLDVHVACTIRDTLSLAKAAQKISVPRATLVASLLRLERKLGNRLFERRQGSGVVKLTEYGKFILPLFEQLLWLHKNIIRYNDLGFNQKNMGEVTITSVQTLLEGFIIPNLKPFLDENEKLKVGIHQNDDISNIRQEINDICIGVWMDQTDQYTYFPFHKFQHKLWASPLYLQEAGEPTKVEDLVHHRILAQKNVNEKDIIVGNDLISRVLTKYIDTLNIVDVAGPRVVDIMAEEGLGIMIASEETVRLSNLKLERVLPDFTGDEVEIFVRVKKEFLKTPLAQFMIDWIFWCRDKELKKINIKPSSNYKPFNPED